MPKKESPQTLLKEYRALHRKAEGQITRALKLAQHHIDNLEEQIRRGAKEVWMIAHRDGKHRVKERVMKVDDVSLRYPHVECRYLRTAEAIKIDADHEAMDVDEFRKTYPDRLYAWHHVCSYDHIFYLTVR